MQPANMSLQNAGTSGSLCVSISRSAVLSKLKTSAACSVVARRWQGTVEASQGSTRHPAAVLFALSVPFLFKNDAVAKEAFSWPDQLESYHCMAKSHADRPQHLLDLAAREAPALAHPDSSLSGSPTDTQPAASTSQPPLAAPLGAPDTAAPLPVPQEQATPSQQSPLRELSPPLSSSPPPSTLSPPPDPTPGLSPDEVQKSEEEQRKSLRKTRRSRIKELEDIRAELAQKQQQLIDREKELLDKDQTVSTLREELDLERKLRGLLTKEKEKAEEQAALAMGLCTGAFALP